MDVINKKKKDMFDHMFIIEGLSIDRLIFVDDIVEFLRSFKDVQNSIVANEVFQKANRLNFKSSKCKLMVLNGDANGEEFILNGARLDVVTQHKYLGTLIGMKVRKDSHVKFQINDVLKG